MTKCVKNKRKEGSALLLEVPVKTEDRDHTRCRLISRISLVGGSSAEAPFFSQQPQACCTCWTNIFHSEHVPAKSFTDEVDKIWSVRHVSPETLGCVLYLWA